MDAAERTRQRMPLVAQMIDECRGFFGPECTLRFAQEGERGFGEPTTGGVQAVICSNDVQPARGSK